jgi:hypothetical protein
MRNILNGLFLELDHNTQFGEHLRQFGDFAFNGQDIVVPGLDFGEGAAGLRGACRSEERLGEDLGVWVGERGGDFLICYIGVD